MATAKKTTRVKFQAPAAKTPKARVQVQDQSAAIARRLAGVTDEDAASIAAEADGPKVMVNVPKAFILTDDGYNEHKYGVGAQMMLESHANHEYAIANGVTLAE